MMPVAAHGSPADDGWPSISTMAGETIEEVPVDDIPLAMASTAGVSRKIWLGAPPRQGRHLRAR